MFFSLCFFFFTTLPSFVCRVCSAWRYWYNPAGVSGNETSQYNPTRITTTRFLPFTALCIVRPTDQSIFILVLSWDGFYGNIHWKMKERKVEGRKKRREFFHLTMYSTHFILRLFGVSHMVKDYAETERGTRCRHNTGYSISSRGWSFICTIPQTGYTSREAQWIHHEGLIRRSIALYIAPQT